MIWLKDNHYMQVLKKLIFGNLQYLKIIIIQQSENLLKAFLATNKSNIPEVILFYSLVLPLLSKNFV